MRRILLPVCVALGTFLLLGLGTWQMQRLAWKETLIADREAGLAMPPTAFPDDFGGDDDATKGFDFRKVSVTGVFRHDLELVYGAKARANVLGHHILTPLVLANGTAVLVDRGWVPADKTLQASRRQGQIEGKVTVRGIARYRADDRPALFTPENDPERNLWYHYDLKAMADSLELEILQLVVEADDTPNPGGLPIGGRTRLTLTNNHLQYAVTWYGLAVCLIGVYIVFRRQQKPLG